MVQIFTTDNPLHPGESHLSDLATRARTFESSKAVDSVLVGYSSTWPHNQVTAPFVFAATQRLSLIVAHRPGVMAPTAAARYFSTLNALSGGRLAVNVVVGGADKDLRREGDGLPKAARYERAIEYLDVMKRAWSEQDSFDHHGTYFDAERVRHDLRPESGHIPVFMGGDSDDAVQFGATHADRYMLWGEPLAGTRERVERVTRAATAHGRKPSFSLSLRLFVADTDEEAWRQARAAEQAVKDATGSRQIIRSASTDTSTGRERQLAYTGTDVHDDCFWTGLVSLLGGFANSAALVGTPDRVLRALAAYRDLGIDAFLLTGGVYGIWEPALENFAARVKREL
ncbi:MULTISPECIES: LLM class flavin-dependent oxidoreductase [unclassified Streptomyces]|uniref:LLM class flavin-dependent oxidoreductase n=1 Tax=unclassified Streptomyces TaxID=2593676 RepID=UPI0035D9744D